MAVCAFWDDAPDATGAVRVSRVHHQPALLGPDARARGAVLPALPAEPPQPPPRGWRWALRLRPATDECWWEEERDEGFDAAISVPAFLLRFPAATRIGVRRARAADERLADFWELLEMAAGAGEKIRPDDPAVTEGVAYLVAQGLMTEADAARVTAL